MEDRPSHRQLFQFLPHEVPSSWQPSLKLEVIDARRAQHTAIKSDKDAFAESLEELWEESLQGIQRLSQDHQRKLSGTNPNLLEEQRILLVSTGVSSLESLGLMKSKRGAAIDHVTKLREQLSGHPLEGICCTEIQIRR